MNARAKVEQESLFGLVPRPLQVWLAVGVVLVAVGLIVSAAGPNPTAVAKCDGAVAKVTSGGATFRGFASASCKRAWDADCKLRQERIALHDEGQEAKKAMLDQYAPGSRGYGEHREVIEYVTAAAATTVSKPMDRNEPWRWAGAFIFVLCCGGGSSLLLRQMHEAPGLEDKFEGWQAPFYSMFVGCNLLNVGFSVWRDPRATGLMCWESYCFGADLFAWWNERVIRFGASTFWSLAFCTFWVLGRKRALALNLDDADGGCGVRRYVALLQIWSVAVPLLVVIPASIWTSAVGRQPDSDMTFALQWILVSLPVLLGELRLIRRARELRAEYRRLVEAEGSYSAQKEAEVPPDPTTPLLGEHGWSPITAGLVVAGVVWSVMEWSGVRRAISILGW